MFPFSIPLSHSFSHDSFGCNPFIMYHLLHLGLFALAVSARCTGQPRQGQTQQGQAQQGQTQAGQTQYGQTQPKLAQLPAGSGNTTISTNTEGPTPGLDGLATLPPGSGGPNTNSPTPNSSGASGCPPMMKAVAFNGGMNPGMFDTIGAADDWLTFSPSIPGGPASPHATRGFVPMMAFASDVQTAISMMNSGHEPEWMLTFNEPDYSYMGYTPTMTGAQAAKAIAPLIAAAKGKKTKFVAPVTADPFSKFHDEFYAACNCRSFFSAYNIHQYNPSSAAVIQVLKNYRAKWGDKPLWLTEVAPGGSGCSTSWQQAGQFMREIYRFAKQSGWVERVFWNTGNQIDGGDQNVCNSYLLDKGGKPSPLLDMYKAVDCS